MIPGGGINKKGEWKCSKGKGNYLFSVKALSDKFKKKFLIDLVGLYKKKALQAPSKVSKVKDLSNYFYNIFCPFVLSKSGIMVSYLQGRKIQAWLKLEKP